MARLVPPSRSSRPNRSIAGAGAAGAEAGATAVDNQEQDTFKIKVRTRNRIKMRIIHRGATTAAADNQQ